MNTKRNRLLKKLRGSGRANAYKTARCILYRNDSFLLAIHNRFRYAQKPRWGIPGGALEWGESPDQAARREIEEELRIQLDRLIDLGDFMHNRRQHRVYAAKCETDIDEFDDFELVEIAWFSAPEIERLAQADQLHTGYEWQAIQRLLAVKGS